MPSRLALSAAPVLKGGRGSVTGVLFGALIMASLLNGMTPPRGFTGEQADRERLNPRSGSLA